MKDDDELFDVNSDIMDEYKASTKQEIHVPKNCRNHFDSSMYNTLGRIITIKVYSHHLNNDSIVKHPMEQPSLNLFVTYANQTADNAAT